MTEERDTSPPARGSARGLAILLAVFAMTVGPLIALSLNGTNEAGDQAHYHLPVIRQFAAQWPAVDLRDYDSATTPGYHLLLAAAMQVVGDRPAALRAIASLFSLALLIVVWRICARMLHDPSGAVVFLLPLAFSSYFIGSAAWLTTDNAGLLFPVMVIGSAIIAAHAPPVRVSLWSILVTFAVLIRQIHLWALTPIVLVAGLHAAPIAKRFNNSRWSARAVMLTMASVLLPIAVVAYFFWYWGGMTPPTFTDQHGSGANFAFISMTLALIGVFGGLPLLAFLSADREARAGFIPWGVIGGIVAAIVAGLPHTSFDRQAGRWGGAIWEAVRLAPSFMDRAPIIIIFAILGGVALAVFARAAIAAQRQRAIVILLISFLGWAVAQCMNAQAWQRYSEPMTLILLAWLSSLAVASVPSTKRRVRTAWFIVAVGQLALSAYSVYYIALRGFAAE